MVYRLACTLSDQIAAVATVSGAYYPFGGCHASRPLPVMEIHGAADQMAPYDGNPDADMEAVQDYLNGWIAVDKCSEVGKVFYQQDDVTATEWTQCSAGSKVVHYRISDGKHAWSQTHVLDTATIIWQFFRGFSH
jgi:polyhydroxybutyrate depolymerase